MSSTRDIFNRDLRFTVALVDTSNNLSRDEKDYQIQIMSHGSNTGFEEECKYLTDKLVQIQEQLKKLLTIRNNLNQSHLLLSRSRVQPSQTAQENARVKRRKKRKQKESKTR